MTSQAALALRLRYTYELQSADQRDYSLLDFAEGNFAGYDRAAHLELVADELEAIERGDNDRLMVFMPPRHGKSTLISVMFPAWALCRSPGSKIISLAHDEDLSGEWGRQVRNIVGSQRQYPAVALAEDSKAKALWHTSQGGTYRAAGMGSSIAGWGGDIVLIDDPHGKAGEVRSEVKREFVWSVYQSEVIRGLEPGAALVLVLHRWDEDDLAGRILAAEGEATGGGRWRVVRLPAVAEATDGATPDLLGRTAGEPLWEKRYPLPALDGLRRSAGEREWNAKWQQRPAPEEGAIFRWFHRYRPEDLPVLREVAIGIDTALGGADRTAWAAWGFANGRAYVLEAGAFRGQAPEAARRIVYFYNKIRQLHAGTKVTALHRGRVGIDTVMAQHLRFGTPGQDGGRMGMPIVERKLPSTGPKVKEDLAVAYSPEFEGARVLVPEWAPWLEEWLHEHKMFPHGAHDDYVETTLLLADYFFRQARLTRAAGPIQVYGS